MTATESTRSKPSLRVLEAIADAEDVSPIALEHRSTTLWILLRWTDCLNRPLLTTRSEADTFRSGTEGMT
ncbi:hypothetical protein C480_18752 [Natrialba aegyptia DSM 13077]|uniref:Uncharacterized protein n=1 Tax=Natrialba aegyptia DSM 13077 TaxID=1227491 RepID=M0AQS3_9EURY|nr:hypothetical protein C480_18752 [Natrialba aegyptia DSM 13077]